MLFKTPRQGVKTAFQYLTRLPFTKGLCHKISELARGPSVAFFSLHRLLDDNANLNQHPHFLNKTALTTKEARKLLLHIEKTLPFVSLPEALEFLKGNQRLDRSVAVLLVEAPYKETIKNLIPLIDEQKIPVAISLSCHSLNTGEPPWMDEVVFRVISTSKDKLMVNFIDRSFLLTSMQERIWAANHLVENLNHCHPKMLATRLCHLREILYETALPPRSERIATIPELLKLASHPAISYIIGGFYQMPIFDLKGSEAFKEIISAKEELRSLFSEALVPVFIYPNGLVRNKGLELVNTMIEGGYEAALTETLGLARPGDNLFRLPLLPLSLTTKNAQFELQGISEAIDEFLLITLAKNKEL